MKAFEIFDEENFLSIGTLIYYEKIKKFVIELQDYLDEWTAPLLLSSFVKRGEFTIPSEISFLWVKERLIPSGRQNINDILKRHKLNEYSEIAFLEKSSGRCSQDNICVKKLETLPEYVLDRAKTNIVECVALDNFNILVVFADGVIKKIDLSEPLNCDDLEKVIENKALFETLKISAGGYAVEFNNSIEISARLLYKEGKVIPLTLKDLLHFVNKSVADTSSVSRILGCSRQNISYLVSEEKLNPIKENVKGNLYLMGDIIRNSW